MNLKGKTAIITGAGQGIGKAIAETLAQNGANTVIADINEVIGIQTAKTICEKYSESIFVKTDISKVGDIQNMVRETVSKFGGVEILVCNAGILQSTSIEDTTEEEWDRIMSINLKGTFFGIKEVIPFMKQKGEGRIINISSLAGRMGGYQNGVGYAASKAGIIGMTMSVARKVAPFGITVNAVAPGTTETELLKDFSEKKIEGLKSKIPLNRLGKPRDVAELVAFLASENASFITGAVIDVNGGMFMG